jgi:hypothetical protein
LEAAQVPEKAAASPRTVAARSGGATNKIAKAGAVRMKRAVLASIKAARIRAAKTPRNSRRKPELWRKVGIPKSRDLRLLMPASLPKGQRFETFHDAEKIDEANIEVLSNWSLDTAVKIERCDGRTAPCSLPCCARCARRFRDYHASELLRIASEFDDPHQIATIYLGAFPAGSLGAADMKSARGALRKKMQRCGFRDVILIGGTEVAWLAKHEKWVPHLHLLAIGVPQGAWKRLRAALNDVEPAIALKVQALKNRPKQISYCRKFNSTHKPGKRGPNGRATQYPLPKERLAEWAKWMGKHRFEDFGFFYGARRRGGRIVPEA